MTKIKTIKFEELMKEFKKYIAKEGEFSNKNTIKYVYNNGKHFMATNAHVMLRVAVEHVSDVPSEVVSGTFYCPMENKIVNIYEEYPNLDRLVSDSQNLSIQITPMVAEHMNRIFRECVSSFDKDTPEDSRFVEMMLQNPVIGIMSVENNKAKHEDKIMNVFYKRCKTLDSTIMRFRAHYMRNALITVRKLYRLSDNDVVMNVISRVRPVSFNQEGVFDLVVSPVRIY